MTEVEVLENGKSGTVWTAVAHIFCAVVGAGVLGLPNSLAWLGWVAGPVSLVVFFAISLWSALLLTKLYRVDRIEFARYHHVVAHVLGRRGSIAVAVFQMLNLVLSDIAYTITGAMAMKTIAGYLGTQPSETWEFALIFGAIELAFSQVPSLEEIWWVSALGTVSSLGYVLIALGLGLAYSGNHEGSIGGRPGTSTANKVFGVLNSLGNLAFAFGFVQVLLEIQDTLRQPPKAEKTMGKAVTIAVTAAFGFYISSAVSCYSALGDNVPGEVLDGFDMAPDWVMVMANIFIVIHMVTAYQVWAQPVFETIESHVKAHRLRRQAAQQPTAAGVSNEAEELPQSKLDGIGSSPEKTAECAIPGSTAHVASPVLPTLSEVELESGESGQGLAVLRPHPSAELRARRMSVRGSGMLAVYNSAPLPDLLPAGWEPPAQLSFLSVKGGIVTPATPHHQHSHAPRELRRPSVLRRSSRKSMYHLDTGAANEHVPLNDQGYLLPLWERLLLRSAYVALCTLVACVIPFFSAVVGLVGAVTFWPLSIGFPFSMYIKVFKPGHGTVALMGVTAVVVLAVCVAATVGSIQTIIASWSSYTLFD